VPLIPDGRTIRRFQAVCGRKKGTAPFIPDNNPLERIMKEIRRRTKVVGAFPDGQSCLNLAAARLRHIAGSQWSTRKYMNMAPLYAEQTSTSGAVA
jgi:transposase-like protein